jgi:hypothetical protein
MRLDSSLQVTQNGNDRLLRSGSRNRQSGLDDRVRLTKTLDDRPDIPPVRAGPKRAPAPVERPFRGHRQKRSRRLVCEDARRPPEELDVVTGGSRNRRPGEPPVGGAKGLLAGSTTRSRHAHGPSGCRYGAAGTWGERARIGRGRPLAYFDAHVEQQEREHRGRRHADQKSPRAVFSNGVADDLAASPPAEQRRPDRHRGGRRRMRSLGGARQ